MDIALGCRHLPLDAVRPRASGAGADGLGDRRDDLGRRAGIVPARQCLGDAATAGGRAAAGVTRRAVAVPVAGRMAALGCGRDRRRARRHGADPAARHRHRRYRALCRRAGDRRTLFRLPPTRARGSRSRHWPRRPARLWRLGPKPGARRKAVSTAPTRRASTRRAAHRVAIVTGEAALPLKCGGLDAIVSQVPAGFRCRSMMPVIDRIDSWRRGAVALWLDADGITVESANEDRGDRPWVPHPRPARATACGDPRSAAGQLSFDRPPPRTVEARAWCLQRRFRERKPSVATA